MKTSTFGDQCTPELLLSVCKLWKSWIASVCRSACEAEDIHADFIPMYLLPLAHHQLYNFCCRKLQVLSHRPSRDARLQSWRLVLLCL